MGTFTSSSSFITPLSVVLFNDNNLAEKGLDQLAELGNSKGGLQFNMPDWSNRTLILTGGLQLLKF